MQAPREWDGGSTKGGVCGGRRAGTVKRANEGDEETGVCGWVVPISP